MSSGFRISVSLFPLFFFFFFFSVVLGSRLGWAGINIFANLILVKRLVFYILRFNL